MKLTDKLHDRIESLNGLKNTMLDDVEGGMVASDDREALKDGIAAVIDECKQRLALNVKDGVVAESLWPESNVEYTEDEHGNILEKQGGAVIYDKTKGIVEWTGDNYHMVRKLVDPEIEMDTDSSGQIYFRKEISNGYEIGDKISVADPLDLPNAL